MITFERTYNAELAMYFMDYVWDLVSEDDQVIQIPDVVNHVWIKAVIDGQVACMFMLHNHYLASWEVHIMCLKEYRKQSRDIARAFISWVFTGIDGCRKLETVVPVIYPAVKNFVQTVGFTQEGTKRACYTKSGSLVDVDIFGITQEE